MLWHSKTTTRVLFIFYQLCYIFVSTLVTRVSNLQTGAFFLTVGFALIFHAYWFTGRYLQGQGPQGLDIEQIRSYIQNM